MQVKYFNELFEACNSDSNGGSSNGALACDKEMGEDAFILFKAAAVAECDALTAGLQTIAKNYLQNSITVECDANGFLATSSSEDCEADAAVLNAAFDSYIDLTFKTCHLTTPTTTVTTSPTTTTTMTTSATSTPTTTAARGRLVCKTVGGYDYLAVQSGEPCLGQACVTTPPLSIFIFIFGELARKLMGICPLKGRTLLSSNLG